MDTHDAVALPSAQVVLEAGGWSAFIPGLPIAADGATFEEAIDELAGVPERRRAARLAPGASR
jgi:hypothetical protein